MTTPKFVVSALMGLLLASGASARDTLSSDEGWVGVQWRVDEAPIVLPIVFHTEAACQETSKKVNDIARQTVHIERQWACQHVTREGRGL